MSTHKPGENDSRDELMKFINVFWERKSYVFLGLILGLVVGTIYYEKAKAVYESRVRLLIIKKGPDVLPMQGDPRASYIEDYVGTQQVLLRSPSVLKYLTYKPEPKGDGENIVARQKIYDQFQALSFSKEPGVAVDQLMASLNVNRGADKEKETGAGAGGSAGGANVLTLIFRGPNLDDCNQVLWLLIEAYKLYLEDTYKDVNQETIRWIKVAQEKQQLLLKDKRKAELAFLTDHPKASLNRAIGKDGATGISERYADLQKQRADLGKRNMDIVSHLDSLGRARANPKIDRAVLRAMMVRFIQLAPDAMPRVPGADVNFDEKLFNLMMAETELASKYGPDHMGLKSVRYQIELVKAFIARRDKGLSNGPGAEDMVTVHVQILSQELEDIGIKEKNLAARIADEEKVAAAAIAEQAELAGIEEDIKQNLNFGASIADALQRIKIITDSGGYAAVPLGAPTLAIQVEPRFALTFSLAAVAGLIVGFGLAYLMDLTDRSFRSEVDIARSLRMPVIGHVPIITAKTVADQNSKLSVHLCTFHRPKSRDAEAFRQIRTALYFSTRNTNCKKLQITSAVSGDGKSTMAANLAISIAQSGKRVLLVDCDLRRPTIHTFFGIVNDAGFSTVLTEHAEPADVTHADVVPGLSVIPAGPALPNPAEVLTSMRFQDCANLLAEKYDFVLFDTPPLLPVTDPAVIAPRMDGVFLVVRLGKRERNIAERSAEILRTLEANVIGVVVNAGRDGMGYGAYGRYYYGRYSYDYGSGGYRYGNSYTYGNDAYYTEEDSPDRAYFPPSTSNGHKVAATPAEPVENGAANGTPQPAQSGSIKRAFRWFLGE